MLVTVTAVGVRNKGLENAIYASAKALQGTLVRFPDVSSPLGSLVVSYGSYDGADGVGDGAAVKQLVYAAHRAELFGVSGVLNGVTFVEGGLLEHLIEASERGVNGIIGPAERIPDVFVVVVGSDMKKDREAVQDEAVPVWRKVLSTLERSYEFKVCVIQDVPGTSWLTLYERITAALNRGYKKS